MNDYSNPPQHSSGGANPSLSVISGIIGGVVVAIIFGALIATGVIGGKETTVINSGGVATQTTAGSGQLKTVGQIYKNSSEGVVSITSKVSSGTPDQFGQTQEGTASGTGVVISKDGYIVTNDHVISGHQGAVTVTFKDDKAVTAKVVGTDPSKDIAVLKVDSKDHDLTPLPLGNSSKVAVGDPVVAIGNPFGLNQTVTTGIVSALQRTISAPNNFSIDNVIQTDAAINPGNSGGPLLNSGGQVIGINSQIATSGTSEGNVGIGFAVPIDSVKQIIPQLEKSGKVDYAYLGVSTSSLTADVAAKVNFGGEKQGAIVQCVVKNGPAGKAGLTAGSQAASTSSGAQLNLDADLIVKIDDTDVKTSEDVQKAVLAKKSGDKVSIEVVRDGKKKTLDATLGTRPTETTNNCSPAAADQQPQDPQNP